MKLRSLSLVVGLLAAMQTQAEEVTVFDVAEQCQVRKTTQGDRYVAPCTIPGSTDLSNRQQLPDVLKTLANSSELNYDFSCESLRPFSLNYQILSEGKVVQQGSLSPQTATAKLVLTNLSDDSQFVVTGYNGLAGFQAIKPGCKLTLQTDELIESKRLSLLQRILIAQAKVIQPLRNYDSATYEAKIDQANEWLKTVYGLVVLSIEPQMGQQLFELINLINQSKLNCLQGACTAYDALQFEQRYQQYKQQLLDIRGYLQQQIEALTQAEDARLVEYQNLLTLLNIELNKL